MKNEREGRGRGGRIVGGGKPGVPSVKVQEALTYRERPEGNVCDLW